jgi:hypothetical protein
MPEETETLFNGMYVDTGGHFAEVSFLSTKAITSDRTVATWEAMMYQYAVGQGGSSLRSIQDTNLDQAHKIIEDLRNQGIEEGLSIPEIEKLIEDNILKEWRKYGKWSAVRIARTEVIAASNYGSLVGAQSTGLSLRKVWLAALDGRERETHAQAMLNSQVNPIDVNQPFPVGGQYLMFPGDKSGSAENTINCRCMEVTVIDFIGQQKRIEGFS